MNKKKLHDNPMLDEYAFKLIEEMAELKVEVQDSKASIEANCRRIKMIVQSLHDLSIEKPEDDMEDY